MSAKSLCCQLWTIAPLEVLVQRGNLKLKSEGFMDLYVEVLHHMGAHRTVSLAHYYEANGDLVPDPDTEIEDDTKRQTVRPLAIRLSSGHNTRAATRDVEGREVVNQRVVRDLTSFLRMWLMNLVLELLQALYDNRDGPRQSITTGPTQGRSSKASALPRRAFRNC
mgnify:CR=1 FL=1